LFFVVLAASCGPTSHVEAPRGAPPMSSEIETSTPAAEGMREDELIQLTKWLRDNPLPIFSILVSRNGKLVYELYTPSIDRDDAHYMMSVTKSVLSALVGIAIDRGRMKAPESSIVDMLPASVFAHEEDRTRLAPLTLRRVMGMSGFDAPDPPRDNSPEAAARYRKFWTAPNRLVVALQQPLLPEGFQYNDSTPTAAVGVLEYGVGESALEWAEETLFRPLGFRNYEWMHEDAAGLDNGGYGLRLRPIDMQKFGITYLQHGAFGGKQIVPSAWVERSFDAWNKSKPDAPAPDYGWFWWRYDFGKGFVAHVANGWKGQRIAVFPAQNVVVTMTACIEEAGIEHAFFSDLVTKVIEPAIENGAGAAHQPALGELLDGVRHGRARFDDFIQYRMVPSKAAKSTHHAFRP
jgi:CubicO group peptidase (beta-lactamase class C family)